MSREKIGDRIRYIRKENMLTQEEFGARIGVKGNTVTGYERGTRQPSDAVINFICLSFDINQTWLRTGEGEPDLPVTDSTNALDKLFSEYNCNKVEMSFLRAYFGLKEKERQAFCSILIKMFPNVFDIVSDGNPLDTWWHEAQALCAEVYNQLDNEKEATDGSAVS